MLSFKNDFTKHLNRVVGCVLINIDPSNIIPEMLFPEDFIDIVHMLLAVASIHRNGAGTLLLGLS